MFTTFHRASLSLILMVKFSHHDEVLHDRPRQFYYGSTIFFASLVS